MKADCQQYHLYLNPNYSFYYINDYYTLVEVLLHYQLCGLGVTSGLHRLWSHRSYEARDFSRFLIMLLVLMANQGSIYHWVRDHRLHHKYSDTNLDPHNINRGFFFSHIGWLLTKKTKEVIEEGKKVDCSDLFNDWIVVLNNLLWPYGDLLMCYFIPGLYGYYRYGSFIKGFLLFGCLRWVILSHATWSVNSFAHKYGHKTFRNINARDNLGRTALMSAKDKKIVGLLIRKRANLEDTDFFLIRFYHILENKYLQ